MSYVWKYEKLKIVFHCFQILKILELHYREAGKSNIEMIYQWRYTHRHGLVQGQNGQRTYSHQHYLIGIFFSSVHKNNTRTYSYFKNILTKAMHFIL